MMERVELRAQSRSLVGKQVKRMRTQGCVPAVVYGPDMDSKPILAEERTLSLVLRQAGSTALIDLSVDKGTEPYVVLAREIQRDILTGRLLHVDFYQVRLTEKVKTTPRLQFVGEPHLVKIGEAVMIHSMNQIEVECLPTDLIDSIEVDVSGLESWDDNITVRDLPVPDAVTMLADPSEVVVSLVPTSAALSEEEEEMLDADEETVSEEEGAESAATEA
jgi:large subunit ribosomal protein L25